MEREPKYDPYKKPENIKEELKQIVRAYHDWIFRIGNFEPEEKDQYGS